ncbi:acylphosphatase [Enterococcus florum]|uniref:acylphosphatase n=1 Tax=Enterococcus florum TaxID=2480627 RepID=A0A4P5P7N8_9ENTE|nr:acylphosphatase [Enterococcus florum]GCF93506.1 acylphosphatase [Enterococcus florum]
MKLQIQVTGRVQGVGFRYTTQQIAREIGITGTVKNELDGSVSIQAIGSESDLEEFLEQLAKPQNPFSKVDSIRKHEDPSIEDRKKFDVIY